MQFFADIIPYLGTLAVRSLALAALALAAIYLLRVKSAAAQHAVWTAVVAGMLLLPAFGPLFPGIPLRILPPPASVSALPQPIQNEVVAELPSAPGTFTVGAGTQVPEPVRRPLTWAEAGAAVYFTGVVVLLFLLAFGYRAARRLVSSGRPVEGFSGDCVLESSWITVPVTVGFLRPQILLPVEWREWPAEKLEEVLVHERTHVERSDWAIAAIAGLNRRLFWFHPLAWWMERHLAVLAERACDDAALLALGARERYAQTLLDMAAAVQTGRGRLLGEAMAMAKTAEVRKRIERILDETRPIPCGLTRARWVTLAVCSLPLVYMASVMQLARAQEIRLAAQVVAPPPQAAVTMPDSPAAQQSQPAAVKPPFHFQRLFPDPGEPRFFSLDTAHAHAHPILMPSARSKTFFFTNHGEPQPVNLAFAAPAEPSPAASEPQETPQANFLVEVDASSQPPYPYRFNMSAALPVQKVDPVYPAQAKAAGIQGDVRFSVVVGTDGHVLSVQPIAGNPLLQAAATDAVRQYLYPARPLSEIVTTVTVPFRLDGGAAGAVAYDAQQGNLLYQPVPASSPGNSPPRLTVKVEPGYPMDARAGHIQGTVKLSVTIDANGQPVDVRIVQSVGSDLDEQAVNAVRKWKFKPAYQDGQPVEYVATIQVNFRLL